MTTEAHSLARPARPIDGRAGSVIPSLATARLLRPTALAGALLALLLLALAPATERARTLPASPSAARLSALPLAARSLVSRTLGKSQAAYAIHRSGSGLAAGNRAQGLSLRFGAQGVQVRSGSDTVALRLHAAGYGRSLQPVATAVPTGHANRVSYRRGSMSEWYANGPLGLEQGFTLKAPPADTRARPLTVALSLSGSLQPKLEHGARSLTFAGSRLRYTGLVAFDARGKKLPARLQLRRQTLLIRVDDRSARYPLTIDPFVQQAKLTASDPASNGNLGASVAISSGVIVAGAPSNVDQNSSQQDPGAVYVFVKPAGGWMSGTEAAKLVASDGALHDRLGTSVGISGDTIVAGAPGATISGHDGQGAAYVFVKPAGGWMSGTETAKLIASDGALYDHLGASVGISGDTIVAGAPGARVLRHPDQGAAYIFGMPSAGWASGKQTAKLTASDGRDYHILGISVAISGDTVAAGAVGADGSIPSPGFVQGAVYVFVQPAGGWVQGTETAKLTVSDSSAKGVGHSVAISGDTIVTGVPYTDWSHLNRGAAYVFVEPAGGWTDGVEAAKLASSDGASSDHLGDSVAISGDTIAAGAPNADRWGAAYVFVKPAGGWVGAVETQKLTPLDGSMYGGNNVQFGGSVAASTIAVVAGAYRAGAAYVFGQAPAVITVTKHMVPAYAPGRFDLRVGQTVVKAGAGQGGTGAVGVAPGTYRVSESAAAGTSLSGYGNSIACTINDNPGPSADGTSQVDVTVAEGDQAVCTITNKRKAQIALRSTSCRLGSGRFDLKVGQTVVKAAAGEGDSGSRLVGTGTYTVSELAAAGTSLSDYTSSIACTRNGSPGPSGSGTSLSVSVDWADVLACTVTNRMGATITLRKDLRPSSDPGRFDLKVAGTVVKASAGNGGSGSIQLPAGTYRVAESAAAGTTLSTYATSIACTRNGNPGPSADGTTQLDVTVAVGDELVCTLTNRHKAQVTLTKHLVPSSDPGRFDLKLSSSSQVKLVKASAGDGDSGTIQVAPGAWTVLESAATGSSLSDYISSIVCTRNGNPGPSGNGPSLQLTLSPADVLACTITNQRK